MCDRAELDMKLLVGRRNQLAVRPPHRSAHRACKIRNRTRPFALSDLHFIGMINQMIVGERLEKFDGLRRFQSLRVRFKTPSLGSGAARPGCVRHPAEDDEAAAMRTAGLTARAPGSAGHGGQRRDERLELQNVGHV